ncbi:hypothetical protein E4T50_07628 [Aureobasidium sp. EXF-12298]|nr:hypothetical protein E4T50_07628 [Aureobasidium sp. EXF-12298]KAI4753842.1 hypothetical protein E4T51_13023 [Aureobasidium sp. EXF-12344]KAI4774256.1 hypothetical protein E4T52_10771 [Aureobasidium sp. EXF-3400]
MNSMASSYDFHPISPTALEPNPMFTDHDMSSQMSGNPSNMWSSLPQTALDGGLEKLLNNYSSTTERYGQVTPPDDANMHEMTKSFGKRVDSGASGMEVNDDGSSMSPRSSMSSKRPSVRSSQKSRKESRTSEDGLGGDKKDKYREKNRVAAAKCRAKKKEHTDQLEDTYRTQSAMNSALKQTEKSLRDELSYWRTQALQHTFCNCHPIQEYNMRKAQSMAFGGNYGATSSPVVGNGRSTSFSHNHVRSSSAAVVASPVMSDGNGKTPSVASLSEVTRQ